MDNLLSYSSSHYFIPSFPYAKCLLNILLKFIHLASSHP